MNVFLSHINEEAQVAGVLAQWIESSLDRDVHLSGETEEVALDEQRLAEVDRALGAAGVVLLLCSDRSIGRPWINFESGCAWLKGVPVVAVCHSGCSTADQPAPLGGFPAFDLADAASCHAMLETLAELVQKKRIPRIDVDLMVAELRAAVGASHDPEAEARSTDGRGPAAMQANEVAASVPVQHASVATPPSIEVRVLATIGHHPDFTWTALDLAASLEAQESEIRRSLDELMNNDLLTQRASTLPTDPETRYACTDRGRDYLAQYA